MAVLGERVLHHPGEGTQLGSDRDHLAADRVVRVVGIDERDEVGRDVDPELVGRREPLALVVGQVQDLLELLERVQPVGELPAPVVPLVVGDVFPDPGAAAHGGQAVRAELAGRIAPVHERGLVGDPRCDRRRLLFRVHRPRVPFRWRRSPDPVRAAGLAVSGVHRSYALCMVLRMIPAHEAAVHRLGPARAVATIG